MRSNSTTSVTEGDVVRIKPGIRYIPFQGCGSDVVLCCLFWCQSFGDASPYVCSLYF